jgi:hypothetical protein
MGVPFSARVVEDLFMGWYAKSGIRGIVFGALWFWGEK